MTKDSSNSCGCSGDNGQQATCAGEKTGTDTTIFHVSNMDCRREEGLVRFTLEGISGVERLEFDLPQRKLTVAHSVVTADALEQALNAVGMKAQAVRDAAVLTIYYIENMDCPSEEKLIRSHLGAVEGVQDLDFDLAERTLSVKHLAEARTQMEQVLASIGMHAKEQTTRPGGSVATAPLVEFPAPQPQPTAPVSVAPAGERVTYRIENMDCPTEEALIRNRLGKEPGVTALDFNLMQRVLGVHHTLASTAPIEKALVSIGNSVWIGEIIILHDDQEIVPVRFGTRDFWVGFTSPQYEAGSDPDLFHTFCENWSDGFAPADFSRLVKFARTESCDADRYQPDLWKLSAPEQIYQFSQTIGDAVVFHAETYAKCREYFFWPASGQLNTLYKRTFRYIDRHCLPQQFRPILDSTGVFNGYQRT